MPSPTAGYKVITWGCQMNVEDSEQMELHLQDIGLSEAASLEDASVVLLNTCSVRKKPEDKAFSMLGVLRKLKDERPDIVIGVCGCMAQLRADEIRKRAPHVDFVIGTAHIEQIPSLVAEARQTRRFRKRTELPERRGAVVTDIPQRNLTGNLQPRTAKVKAFLPIQYGCDKFCAFCIVPTTRGRERSRPTEDILEEARVLAGRGVKELTLLGQTVNSYGKNLLEGKVPFAQLLWELAEIEGIERIRYTSPYPRDYRDDLIAAHRDCAKVMPHIHLPLQSGDDDVLKAMRRQYTTDSYRAIYERLRDEVPGVSIATDIIVGFPGETEEQFRRTLRFVEELRFDSAFMFAYSPRPGTPAAEEVQLSSEIKRWRLSELIDLQNSVTCEINSSQVGEVYEVMIEGPSEKDARLRKGITRHFKTMHFPLPGTRENSAVGRLIQVRASEAHMWGFHGQVLAQ